MEDPEPRKEEMALYAEGGPEEEATAMADDGVASSGGGGGGGGEGPYPLRPVFLGNLIMGFKSEEVIEIFSKPIVPRDVPEENYRPVEVDRVDLKRGYCFVFLKDVATMEEKEQAERFVEIISGM